MLKTKTQLKKRIEQLEHSLNVANESRELLSKERVNLIALRAGDAQNFTELKTNLKFISKGASSAYHYLNNAPRQDLASEMAFSELSGLRINNFKVFNDSEFCVRHTAFYGEKTDRIEQVAKISFNGSELLEYINSFFMFGNNS